jgi:hypothetical protein
MDEIETIEKRRMEYLDVIIEVESSSMKPREASEELIYLVKKLSPAIKEITGLNAMFHGQPEDDDIDQPEEVGKDRKSKRGLPHTRN